MKKNIFHTLIFVMFSNLLFAQIPNAGFETWIGTAPNIVPDKWATMNPYIANPTDYTARRPSAAVNPSSVHNGLYAIKLLTKNITSMGIVRGLAATGTVSVTGDTIGGGYSFTNRPAQLTGWYQWMSGNDPISDSASIVVYLFKRNYVTGFRDTVGKGIVYFSSTAMVMSYQQFSLNINYLSGQSPDSALIILASSYRKSSAFNGSYLMVDSLVFTGTVTSINNNTDNEKKVDVFPNPANNELTFSGMCFTKEAKLIIKDILGKTIFEKEIYDNFLNINTLSFSNGIYNYQLIDKSKNITSKGKFVIKH